MGLQVNERIAETRGDAEGGGEGGAEDLGPEDDGSDVSSEEESD